MAQTAEDTFQLEVLKLLLKFAHADGKVDARELLMVKGLGRKNAVPEAELTKLLEGEAKGLPPPEPDFAILKQRPDDVLEAALAMITSDGRIHPEEKALLAKVRDALKKS